MSDNLQGVATLPPPVPHQLNALDEGERAYTLGRCLVIVTPPSAGGVWSMSMSHPERMPTLREVALAKSALLPPRTETTLVLPESEQAPWVLFVEAREVRL